MSERVFIKPAREGAVVRGPREESYRRLPPEGAEVELTVYWRRRLAGRDVVLTEPVIKIKDKPVNKKAEE